MSTYTWKVYKSRDGKREAWYDRHYRTWVMREVDEEGNEVGMVEYSASRETMENFLNPKCTN